MNRIALALALAALAATLVARPPDAIAIDRPCPAGKEWNVAKKSCVAKARPRQSAGRKYREAVKHLEGKVRRPNPARALKLLAEACAAKHADSCTLLGFVHRYGRQAERSAQKGLDFYKRACELADSEGCTGAAEIHSDGLLGKTDHGKAIPLLTRGCTLKSGRACFELGQKHNRALGVAKSSSRARTYYRQALGLVQTACPRDSNACYVLGRLYAGRHVIGSSAKKAFDAYKLGCDGGSGDACRSLGAAYRYGRGVPKNPQRAYEFYLRGCDKYDDAVSCNDTGWLLLSWKASTRDSAALLRIARRACELDQRYCAVLGNLHNKGLGTAVNKSTATRMYLQACANGNAQSCSVAAYRTVAGNGTPKSDNRARELWERSCNMSWGDACLQVGKKFELGQGVRKNTTTAYRHFYFSCIRDSPEGCRRAGELAIKGKHGKRKDVRLALEHLKSGCSLKDGASCIRLANLYLDGRETPKNVGEATRQLSRACTSASSAQACRTHGELYYRGERGVTGNKTTAARSFIKACKLGDKPTCGWIDAALREASAGASVKSEALRGLTAACETHSNATACVTLGRLYAYGGYVTEPDPRRGVQIFKARCDRGEGDACVQVGWMYAEGRGVVADIDKAEAVFRKQCDRNTAGACLALGAQLWQKKDHAAAVRIYNRACKDGDGHACNGAGFAYYTGKGVTWSPQRAADLYRQACDKGSPVGCSNVGELLWHGLGTKQNRLESFDFYQKGCTPTESSGCTWVGRAYHLGDVVKRDVALAEKNYLRTCPLEEGDIPASAAESCMFLAALYQETGSQPRSRIAGLRQRALALARQNAVDNPYGSWVLGRLHLEGIGTIKSKEKALAEFARGCEGYDANACLAAARLELGDPAQNPLADPDKARFHLERGCAAGLAEACELEANPVAPGPVVTPKRPPPPRKRSACACQSSGGGDAGGLALLLGALGWLGWRGRRRGFGQRR